jgi:hypothetical protein
VKGNEKRRKGEGEKERNLERKKGRMREKLK